MVTYNPSRPNNYVATTVSPLTQTVLEVRDVHSSIESQFAIYSGNPFQPFWRITLTWINGDDQPPYQHRDEKNLLSPLNATQQSLFADDASSWERSRFRHHF